jgi:TrmH family RNA methyltransferase
MGACVVARTLGRQHPTIRRLRALRHDPALRREQGVFLAEGVHLAQEALRSAADIELVVFSKRLSERDEGRALLRAVAQRRLSCAEADVALLDSIQDARSPQPILMLVRRPAWPPDAGLGAPGPTPLAVVAVGIQDPGNLGSVLRTADAAGATACFVAEGSADPFHPRAVRATMGSIFRMPVCVDSRPGLVERLRARGLRLIGTDTMHGVAYHRCDLAGPAAVFFGAEGAGLSPSVRSELDECIQIPMRDGVDSLSVGAAAAVVLFEAARQRSDL